MLMARVEGWDRKSFFAVAESQNGVDNFQFWDYPVRMPELEAAETNLYDMRLVRHEDGWIYGLFCAERHDDSKPDDLSAAVARGDRGPRLFVRHDATCANDSAIGWRTDRTRRPARRCRWASATSTRT